MIPSGSPYLRRHLKRFLEETQLRPEDRILEVGCGMGRYTLLLAELGYEVTGLDLSQNLLNYLEEFNGGRFDIPLVCGDIIDPDLDFPAPFDAAVAFFTLHHFHDQDLCFQGLKRFVKNDGLIAFLEPNAFNPLYYAQIALTPTMSWEGDKGVAQMRESVVRQAMAKAGIRFQKAVRFGFFPPFVTNRRPGYFLEGYFERLPLIGRFLPFQIFIGKVEN